MQVEKGGNGNGGKSPILGTSSPVPEARARGSLREMFDLDRDVGVKAKKRQQLVDDLGSFVAFRVRF